MITATGQAQHWDTASVEAAVRAFIADKHRLPRAQEWGYRNGLPSQPTAYKYLGPLTTRYLQECPAMQGQHQRWTQETIVHAIMLFHRDNDRWPDTNDFRTCASLPHPATVYRHIGTLAEARRRAGMPGGGHEGHGGGGRGGRWTWRQRARQRTKEETPCP